jgi:hypothetical protein
VQKKGFIYDEKFALVINAGEGSQKTVLGNYV